jgi:genome maintenance exonuclease 1
MLKLKYDYTQLSRELKDGKRHYCLPDGSRVPSVTTILDKTKSEEQKQGLAIWKKRVGEVKAQEITTEAANRGTRMHTYLEHYVKTGELKDKGSNPFGWASHVMAQTVISEGLKNVSEFWGVEIPLYFPGVYAGTTDGAGIHLGSESILDYKQTNKPKRLEWIGDYFLQLCAYAEAHNEVYGTNINKGVVLMCVKPETDTHGRIITEPKYQEFVIEGKEFDHWRSEWWKRVELYYLAN